MLTIKHVLPIVALSTSLSCSIALANQTQPEVELTHWWNQPGEIQALNEIKKAVEARGAKFVETRISSWDALRTNILKRISLGYQPPVTQWLASDYSFSFDQISAIYPTPSKWRNQPIEDVLFDEVYKGLNTDNGLVGLPMGIHILNAALFSKEIYNKLGLSIPKDWDEVLRQAPLIKEAGYVPVALSKESWQLQFVLNTILLGELGAKDYKQFYKKDQSITKWREPLIRSSEIFLSLKQFTDEAVLNRNWSEAAQMVGDNKAAMHFLGDFAKSELTTKGLKAGDDFLCSLAPGANGYMEYSIDSFLMFKVDEPYIQQGQSILFDVALDPEVQANFNNKKGGIPIRKGVDINQLDSCAQATYKQWTSSDKKAISFTGIGNPLRASFLQAVLQKAWDQDDMTAVQLVDELLKADNDSMKKN